MCWLAGIPECSSLKYLPYCVRYLVLAMSEITGKYPSVLVGRYPRVFKPKILTMYGTSYWPWVRSQASTVCWLAGIPECSSLKYLLCTVPRIGHEWGHRQVSQCVGWQVSQSVQAINTYYVRYLVLAMSQVTGKYPGVLMVGIPQCWSKIPSYLVFAMNEVSGKYPKVQ